MSKNDNTYHHYVPFCYLKQFGHRINKDPKAFFVYCFDKMNGKTYTKNARKICGENFFYTLCPETYDNNSELNSLSIEKDYLADLVEPKLSKLLNNLGETAKKCFENKIQHFPDLGNIRFHIAWHIVIQFLRHPNIRELEKEIYERVVPETMDKLKCLVANIENDNSYNDLKIQVKYDHALLHAQTLFMNSDLIQSFVDAISKNFWSFMYSPQGEFMTCDCPILVEQHQRKARPTHLGLSQYGSELFFVLNPNLAVHILEREYFEFQKDEKDFIFGETTDEGIQKINLLNYRNAQRYIIGLNNDFSFVQNYTISQ